MFLTNYYANWQATPWLETTLRFTDYNEEGIGIDKGVDVKLRLLKEGNYHPSLAIGLQDFLGIDLPVMTLDKPSSLAASRIRIALDILSGHTNLYD